MLSDRCLSGATSINMAVMKATNPPTVVLPPSPALWDRAITITPDSAIAAIICVTGELVAAAAADLTIRRRNNWLCWLKRWLCAKAAPCRRTMRQASTFSSTT